MNYIYKTLKESSTFIQQAFFDAEFSKRDGLLQKVSPQLKTAGVFALLLCIGLTKNPYILIAFCLLSFILLTVSKIPVLLFLKRFLFIPLFSFIISIPSIFIIKGVPLLSLFGLTITKQGIEAATFLVLRVSASVGITLLLPITTPWTNLISSLKSLKVPWSAILILLIGYRYIFKLTKMVENSFEAKRSRQINPSALKNEYKFLGNKTALFIQKSITLSDNIYFAFLSRGYSNLTSDIYKEKITLSLENIIWTIIILLSICMTALWSSFFV